MSRRDTIIIAVLINIGLLFILFSTAVGEKDDPRGEHIASSAHMELNPIESEVSMPEIESDEMEEVLDKFSKQLAISSQKEEVSIPLLGDDSEMSTQVVVKQGDYLERIAQEHDISTRALMQHNNLKNARLRVGQVLKIPASSTLRKKVSTGSVASTSHSKSERAATSKKIESEQDSDAEYYVIQRGDNPWLISLKYHINLQQLLKINGLDEKSARRLKPGDRIRIR